MKQLCYFFLENGYQLVKSYQKADYIIFSGCSLFSNWFRDSMRQIEKYDKLNNSKTIILGCLSAEKSLRDEYDKIIFVGTKQILRLEKIFGAKIGFTDLSYSQKHEREVLDMIDGLLRKIEQSGYPVRGNISCIISRGCIGSCSYCGDKKAIGSVKSKRIEDIIVEIKKQIITGNEKVDLLADDCGCYGLDIGTNFTALIWRLFKELPMSIGLGHINPKFIAESFPDYKRIFAQKRIDSCSLTLQALSPRLIKLMRREYNPESIIKKISILKEISPRTKFSTHMLIGFPTETKKDFLKAIEGTRIFDRVIFNIYKRIPGTLAARMSNLDPDEMNERIKQLIEICKNDPTRFLME